MTRTILVSGGAGYIGAHTCKALAAAGYTPVTYDTLAMGKAASVRWGPFEEGDIADAARLDAVFERHAPAAVMHFAGSSEVIESIRDPLSFYRNNVAGSLTLMERALANGVMSFVFSSTCAVYGVPERMPIDEDVPKAPINPYGQSKLMVETMLHHAAEAQGLNAVALRYFNAAGASPDGEIGEDHDPETHLVPLALMAALDPTRRIRVFGTDYPTRDGSCVRDFVHVCDLAEAHVAAVDRLLSGALSGFHGINLGSGRGLSVLDVVAHAERAAGRSVAVETAARRPGDPPRLVADPALAARLLGWRARMSDPETIMHTAWAWIRRNHADALPVPADGATAQSARAPEESPVHAAAERGCEAQTTPATAQDAEALQAAIVSRSARVGVIGLGYVGLPLAVSAATAGFSVTGFDTDKAKPPHLNAGTSYIDAVPSETLGAHVASGRFTATGDMSGLSRMDVIVVCVPTPLTRHREPDLSFVTATARTIAATLRPGQLVAIESTTWPGTTEEVVRPILEDTGLVCGADVFLAYSPEREDPGSKTHATPTIPKIVAGDGPEADRLAREFYGAIAETVVPVSSPRVAEATKITENVFRAVNIALVNELKTVYDAMGIDVWEVIGAASTKPFGYMPFYPGPGLGGHCIPVDPFYLTWKAREHGVATRFVELAGEVNLAMPDYVIGRLQRAVDEVARVSLGAARVLVIGLAYKPNVADVRESPSLVLLERLEAWGTRAVYHDPHVSEVPATRRHAPLAGRRSVPLSKTEVATAHAVLIATDHDAVDYDLIAAHARLVVDTRNAMRRRGLTTRGRLVLA